eukprot:scaffold18651_cov14-Tisochrysis_lutea.AAC.1
MKSRGTKQKLAGTHRNTGLTWTEKRWGHADMVACLQNVLHCKSLINILQTPRTQYGFDLAIPNQSETLLQQA